MLDVENLHTIQSHLEELQEITERRYLERRSVGALTDEECALQLQAEFTSDFLADKFENVAEWLIGGSGGRGSTSTPTPGPSNDSPSTSRHPPTIQEDIADLNGRQVDDLNPAHNAQIFEIIQRIDSISESLSLGTPNDSEIIKELCDTTRAVCGRVDELTRNYKSVVETLNSNLNRQFNENESVRSELKELKDLVENLQVRLGVSSSNSGGDNEDRVIFDLDAPTPSGVSEHGHRATPSSSNIPSRTSLSSQLRQHLTTSSPNMRVDVYRYPVRIDPITFGHNTDYHKMARDIVRLVYHPSGLSSRMRGYREGSTTLRIMWKTEMDARRFFEAWHEVDHEDEWAKVSVSPDFWV